LVPFVEPINRISVGRRTCLALAESGALYTVDHDFATPSKVSLTSTDVIQDFPSTNYSVIHVAAGWRHAGAVIKHVGLVVWCTDLPPAERDQVQLHPQQPRIWKARKIHRPELSGHQPSDFEIIGLMVGDGFLVYLTKKGSVHRVSFNDESFDRPEPPSSFVLNRFTTAPQLCYLSGSFSHFGLFNKTGEVLCGNADTGEDSEPIITTGLQHSGIISITWGDWHALALCENGSILSWGKELRLNGCLGLGYDSPEDAVQMGLVVTREGVSCSEPRTIKGFGENEPKFAFCAAAGGWHSAALVADFKVQKPSIRQW
jgi:SCF-associated factor 1